MDFHTYPKPLRLPIGKRIASKDYMDQEGVRRLLRGMIVVEEKMDGRQSFFETDKYILWVEDLKIRHSILYRIPGRYALFDVYEKSTGRFLNIDQRINLWLEQIRFNKLNIENNPLIFPVPIVKRIYGPHLGSSINEWENSIPVIIMQSSYAIDPATGKNTFMEGIVIKQDRTLYYIEVEHGKVVRDEFISGITENYINRPKEYNIIDISMPMLLNYETGEKISWE